MVKANKNPFKSIDISSFLYLFTFKHNNYTCYHQHDAQEFFRLLLEDLIIN